MTSRLTIGSLTLPMVSDVQIESGWDLLTDTATIVLPKNLTVDAKPIVEGTAAVFRIGDPIKIKLGYDFLYDTVFTGYVADIKTKVPLELLCEDQMWLFKQQSYKKTFKEVTVQQLVEFLLTKIGVSFPVVYSYPSLALGKFRVNSATGAQVLEELRKTYGIQSYFRDGTLYVGFAYTHESATYRRVIPLEFNRNVIEDDLIYKDKNNVRVKLKGVALNSGNQQLTAEAGDGDGITVTKFYYQKSQGDLQQLVDNDVLGLKYSGFEGSLLTFGKPWVRHGDAVQLRDPDLPERDGTYLVKRVKRMYNDGGYRQDIELDRKISNT